MYEALEAEQSVISCLIQRAESMEETYSLLSPEMFDSGLLGRIYFEFRKAFDDHKGLTLIELHQILEADYPDYEIDSAFKDCVMQQAMPFQIKGFAEVIQRHYKASSIKAMFDRLELKEADIDDQIDRMIADLESLQGGSTSEGSTIAQIAEEYKDKYFNGENESVKFLGVEEIDKLTGGFQGGDLVILAGRPASGKSSLALQWAEMFANQGLRVGYYNLEMQKQAVYERLVAGKSGIEVVRMRKATRFCNEEEEQYKWAVEELLKQDRIVIFSGAKSAADIRKDQREYKFGLIILDYLQLMTPSSRYQGNRAAEVSQISRDLKDIAMSYDVPVLALSQLNRASESRKDKEPMMADIRESGAIEQDASIIFMLWNSDENDRSQKGFKTEKSRAGQCGRVDLVFTGSRMRFELADNVSPFGA